ncbi:unnamed protein product [Albugo candida]|uniref:Tetraspanin n=1 Tax=Albugo candida TaxID=65357 RepID=A0A024GEG7_9STRA|nr:unnamed protein product [Albugo candida]|eukprot:CCI44736.1 unnamed protein product [Albugo candida]
MRGWRSLSRKILVFTNVLFLCLGAVLVILGGYIVSDPNLNAFTDGGISSAITTCGFLIILIALFGCCGAQRDSKIFLFPYALLVLVSVIGQIALAGYMSHVHGALVEVTAHDFDLHSLRPNDRSILRWINHRFRTLYNRCDVQVDLTQSMEKHHMLATCENKQLAWFAVFLEKNCRLDTHDLQSQSTFMKCVGQNFTLNDPMNEHTMLCACENRLVRWVNDQSMVLAVTVSGIALFETALVLLSFYVICTRRGRRHGYKEIRMPLKTQQPYNPHPRNYQTIDKNDPQANIMEQRQHVSHSTYG